MKCTVRENITVPYSLHDMNVVEFAVFGDDIIMRTQSGILRYIGVSEQVEGYVEFHDVRWDFPGCTFWTLPEILAPSLEKSFGCGTSWCGIPVWDFL